MEVCVCVCVQACTFPVWGGLRGACIPYVGMLTWIHPCVRGESPAWRVPLAWVVCVRVCTSPAWGGQCGLCVYMHVHE